LAILNSSCKIYLKLEGEAEDLITSVLQQATDQSDNPDLRNRGYIYWRMLSENPEEAKNIILCEKPTISEDSGHIEPQLLDKLIDNISMLSSVYYKPPETFAKKVRDRINERLDLETDEVNRGESEVDYIDSMGISRSEYIKDSGAGINNYNDLIKQDADGDLLNLDGDGASSIANGNSNTMYDLLGNSSSSNI
jgi:AP-1 complex subunit beta-1